ncbi:CHAD domain-containing protein [Phenylobacterium immobile]|uniref:CHAD domain-containing protein n=1 Tax=Phenylobacterium immobile TaxID=21 RepID=UPI000A59ABBD|nr:CHAD domain-containing protein [Phenylobacterium immobile]
MADGAPLVVEHDRLERRIRDQLAALPQIHRAFLQSPDPQRVHALRRALRRLAFAQALEAACAKAGRKPTPPVKRANRLLGRVRDLDVLRLRLEEERPYTLATNADDLLAARLFHRRQDLVIKATHALGAPPLGPYLAGALLEDTLCSVDVGRLEAVLRDIVVRQDRKLRRALRANTPMGPRAQHRLRRRARRLRYAVELLAGDAASHAYMDRLAELHSTLGDAHDRHVQKRIVRRLLPEGEISSLDFHATMDAAQLRVLGDRLPKLPDALA